MMTARYNLRWIWSAAALLLSASCTTTMTKVASDPEGATVEVYQYDSRSYKSLGTTPIEIDEKSLPDDKGQVLLRISKDKFMPTHVVAITGGSHIFDFQVQLEKAPVEITENKSVSQDKVPDISNIVEKVQFINSLERSKNYQGALDEVNALIADYKDSYFLWDIKGSLHLMLTDKERAMGAFQKSLALNPQNEKTRRAVAELSRGDP